MRGVSLEEISAATRISTRFLEALENDQWDQLPGGVFNRGFIRSVARFLGLDEDNLVAEYALETKNRVDAGVIPNPPVETRRNWGPAIVAFGVLAAIAASGWFLYVHYGSQIAARLYVKHSASASSTVIPTASTFPAHPALELKIKPGKSTDLKVVADGRAVYDGHVEAGNVMRFEAKDSLEISAADSGSLLLELNGQKFPPIGIPGQSGSIKLTQNDLKSAAGGTH